MNDSFGIGVLVEYLSTLAVQDNGDSKRDVSGG